MAVRPLPHSTRRHSGHSGARGSRQTDAALAPLPAADCRAALARLVASPQLSSAPRLAAFLEFVVDRTLAGHAKSLKAYTIAIGALGRSQDFDPATDAIVRVEAGRLRRALARYYGADGVADAVIITLPRGGYVPSFRWRDAQRIREVEDASRVRSAVVAAAETCFHIERLTQDEALRAAGIEHRQQLRAHLASLKANLEALRSILLRLTPVPAASE
jgi:hypothetical protein